MPKRTDVPSEPEGSTQQIFAENLNARCSGGYKIIENMVSALEGCSVIGRGLIYLGVKGAKLYLDN